MNAFDPSPINPSRRWQFPAADRMNAFDPKEPRR